MDNLIDKMVTAMKKNNLIEEDDEIIRTGLNILIIKICFIFVVIIIGIFAGIDISNKACQKNKGMI